MRKLVICLLVFGLYAIQTVGHMNSDPAPGRSPGPPVVAATTFIASSSSSGELNENDEDAPEKGAAKDIKNNPHSYSSLNTNNNNHTYPDTNDEDKDDKGYEAKSRENTSVDNDDEAEVDEAYNNNTTALPTEAYPDNSHNNDQYHSNNNYADNNQDNESLHRSSIEELRDPNTPNSSSSTSSALASTPTSSEEDAINFQLTKTQPEQQQKEVLTNHHHLHHEAKTDTTHSELPENWEEQERENKQHQMTTTHASPEAAPATSANEDGEQMQPEHGEAINVMSSSYSLNQELGREEHKEKMEHNGDLTSSATISTTSCRSELDDFLNEASAVIDAVDLSDIDTKANQANSTTSSSSGTSLTPPYGMQIELSLQHDTFDTSSEFGINCGLLYKVHLTMTPVLMGRTTTAQPEAHTPSSSSSNGGASSAKQNQQTTKPELLNPAMHYTGDFFVETVSLLNAQDRGSFVSESSGNKLPISWFTSTTQQNGKRQLKNPIAEARTANGGRERMPGHAETENAFGRNEYGSSLSLSAEEMGSPSASRVTTLDDDVEYIGHVPTNIFFKDFAKVRNAASKLKREQQLNSNANNYQSNNSNNNNNNNMANTNSLWLNDNSLSSSVSLSSPSSSLSYKRSLLSVVSGASPNDVLTATGTASNQQPPISSPPLFKSAKQRRATTASHENIDSCPDNKWHDTVQSHTNAAGGISSETSGMWWVNELCEQDDIIEFRVFFRVNMREIGEAMSNRSNRNRDNASGHNGHHDNEAAATADEAQIVVYKKTFQFHIRKDCHLMLRESSMGTLDYTVLPLYCIDCTVHFPKFKQLNNAMDERNPPPGMLVELQRLNVPCASGGFVRFNRHKLLCGKLEELDSSDRIYHFNVRDDTSVQFYRNPMFSLSFKLVDYCYNVSTSNQTGEFYIRPSMKDTLECYFRIHLPYGNRVLLRMVTNNESDILPMPRLVNEDAAVGGAAPNADDEVIGDELYTIFSRDGATVAAQIINLTLHSGGQNFGAYSPVMPLFKTPPEVNYTNSRNPSAHADMKQKTFGSLGLDSYGFLAVSKANLQMAFAGTANCMGVVIKVFEDDNSSKWSHCVNDTRYLRGFILESSSNTLSIHLFRSPSMRKSGPAYKGAGRGDAGKLNIPAIYLSYQARPLKNIVSNCAFGWIAMQQFCIATIELTMSWHEGEKHCSKLGGHLVSIRNEQQQQTINELLIKSPGYKDENAYWVGGSDKSYEGDFRWSDGLLFQYTNWFPGWSQHGHYNKQPNDDGLSSQDCIELRRYFRTPPGIQSSRSPVTNRYMWNDRDCSANNYLICERAMDDESMRRTWLNDCNKTVSLSKEHPRASIWSPSFPRQYPDNANCYTTVTAPAGYRIVVEFEELVIENEPGCTYDYLEITEPKLSESLRTPTKTSSNRHRYAHNMDRSPNLRTYRKRSSPYNNSPTSFSSNPQNQQQPGTTDGTADHSYAPMNTDYNGYDLSQTNYQKLLQIYSSLYGPRDDFVIQTPDYPHGNPYYQHPHQQQQLPRQHHHHSPLKSTTSVNDIPYQQKTMPEIVPKRLCGDWSTKLKLLRYVSKGSYLGLHFVSDYSHHFGGYKAKTYMENRSHLLRAASECSNERLKPYNGSCYLFVSYPEVDWNTAQQVCRGMGASLTSVSSADEHRFITSNIRNQIDYSPQLIYWLGAELEKNLQFEWTDGSKMIFQGWLPGQGQFETFPADAICMGLQWKMSPTPMLPSGLYWQSQKCSKVGGYVCKKPKESFGSFAFSNFTVTGTEGRLVSPAYPNTYPLNINYWIHIKAPERMRIIVQFQKIDLEPQDECLYDFISIQDYDSVSKITLEPGANVVPMAMLMSAEQLTAYEGDNEDAEDGNGGGVGVGGDSDIISSNVDAIMAAEALEQTNVADNGNNEADDDYENDNETTLRGSGTNDNRNKLSEYPEQRFKRRLRRSIDKATLHKGNTAKLQAHTLHHPLKHRRRRNKEINFHHAWMKHKSVEQLNPVRLSQNDHTRGVNKKFDNRKKHHKTAHRQKNKTLGEHQHNRVLAKRHKRKSDHEHGANGRRHRRSTIVGENTIPPPENAQTFLPYVRWCGTHESNMSKFDFVSSSNEVMLNFHSDYSMTSLGFAAIWKAIDVSGCPLRTLTSREGTIASPNYPHFLLNNLNCAFVIQAPVGKRVWLEIIEYDFLQDAMLEVDLGNGAFRPFEIPEHVNDGMFVSLKEQLRVQFRTGQHPRGKGFQAIFHTVGQMEKRERIIKLTSNDTGHLYQLNFPHDMPENVDFTQHLVAPFGHNILLELHDVEFSENGCPDNNIIEVYDNYADNNGTKWQLCKFQYANVHTGSPLDDSYFTTNYHMQQPELFHASTGPGEFQLNNDVVIGSHLADGHMDTTSAWASTTTIAEFLLRQQQQQQQQQLYVTRPTDPPPVYITSYLNTLYIRQRTTAKSIANLNCTVRLQWDNNYKIKLVSGDKSVESCQPNPCQYNGKCIANNGSSYCQCLGHYTGRFCGLNMCELDPCVFGRCELTTTNFKCHCQPGYMGTTCEQKQKPCSENPCEGRGICIEKNGGFFCRCYAWWEGHRCEKRMLHIPYKPLSERMLQEPFWLGLITVFVVLAVIGLVWCAKRHFPEKIEKLLAEEADRNRPPGSVHGHHHHTSLREQLQFTTAIPQSTVNNAPGAPRSIFNRLGSPSPRKKRNNSTPVKKNAAEKKQILQQLVSPAAQAAKPKVSLGELISLSENRLLASTIDSESDQKETTFSENTGSLTSATVERAINDPKLEKKVTFARLLNKVSAEMSSGSEATRNSSALSLPTDIQLRASSMPPSPCTNDIRSPHSTPSNHGSDSFSSSDLALTDFGLRSIQTSGSEMGSTNNHQLSGLPMGMPPRCRIGSPARPKVSSADSILAMFRNFAAANTSNVTTGTMPSSASVFVSPSTTPTVSSPQDDAPGDDESSTSSMHTPVSYSSGPPDSPVFYRQTTIEVPVLDVLNAHKSTSSSSSTSSTSNNLLHPPTILLEIPSSGINNKCLSPIREMPTPIPSPALTPIMQRGHRSSSPIFQEDPLSGGDFTDDDDKSDGSDTHLSEKKLLIGLQKEKSSRLIDSDVETAPTDTTTTSMAELNKPTTTATGLGLYHKLPMLSITPVTAVTAAPMQQMPVPAITIDVEPPTPEEKLARPRDLIIPTLTVEQPSPTKNRHPMIIFPGSPPPQRASIGETSFMFPNKQQQKRLLKQFEKPTSLDFPFVPPMITVTSNMSELESDTEPLSPAPKTLHGGAGGLMPPNPVGMCYLSPFTMCTRADRTISESNLSSSGYSSMASPGPSRCGSSNPLYPNEMDEPGSGHTGPGLSLHVNLMNRRKSSVLPSCKENISNGKCTGAAGGAKTDRLHCHRPRSDSETFSDDILIESNDEGIGTDHVDEKLDETRLSSRRFDMFLDDEVLIEVEEPPPCTLSSSTSTYASSCAPQMAQLQLPSIVIQIDGCGDKTLSPVSSRSESPLSERAGIGRFSPHFYGRKDQLPFTDSDGLYDFPSSDGKGTSAQSFSHQRRSSSKKRERKLSKCSATQSPTKQLDIPSKESLNTSSTPSSIGHVCNKHCHSHHHPCPAVTVTTRKSPKRRLHNRHAVASSSSSSESLNSTKELTVRPLPRRLNSPNREKRPRKQESVSEDEVADSILRRISPSIVKKEEPPKPKCKINRLRAIGIQIRFLRRLEKSVKTRERIASPSDSCPEENTDDMDSPQASSPLLQPTSPSKTRLALCRQKRLPSGTYGITAAEMNSSNWKGMDRSLIGDDVISD
ncbi:uncharacterized protein LOC106084839 isoform X3 [Stomoxys calcitrans]|uniref:uncharacterized protein LOC106084839 isoform X3 n=1 Tax=Stomoxys calcitrans TaxID=35570 RepID=UPI0027E3036C|nr:uncharacterized protein LOC106084839 isoform X3 [Stomoxys calcitrans]